MNIIADFFGISPEFRLKLRSLYELRLARQRQEKRSKDFRG
jgi:plasmid maintenance system antidote protein VapI